MTTTDVTSCDHVSQRVSGVMNAHHPDVTCTTGDHPARYAHCLPDGTHLCPEHDPDWIHDKRIEWKTTPTMRPRPYRGRSLPSSFRGPRGDDDA